MLIARDLKRRLEHWGHDVIDMIRTGTDVVTTSMVKCPDLILMDIQLNSDMDGIEAGEIISPTCDTSIVHVTANTDPLHDREDQPDTVPRTHHQTFLGR